jgi:hypothetical protein
VPELSRFASLSGRDVHPYVLKKATGEGRRASEEARSYIY